MTEYRNYRVYLLVPEFSMIDGVAEQVATLAIELADRGLDILVFIRRPCAPDNQYLLRLKSAGLTVVHPPRVLGFLGRIDWSTRDRILQTITRLASPLLVLPSMVDAVIKKRTFRRSLDGALGNLNRVLGKVLLPDYLDRIFNLQLSYHVCRQWPDVVEISRSDYIWQIDWFRERGIATVYKEHSTILEINPDYVKSLHRADGLIAVSDSAAAALQQSIQSRKHVQVVPNAVDIYVNLQSGASPASSAAPGLGATVLCVSRLSPEKGVQYLPEVARMVIEASPKVHFVVAGDGPLKAHLAGERERLGLGDQFTLLGALSRAEVLELLQNSDVFLLPSLTEGMPVSVIEAMACGRPIVATAVGGTPELIRHGVSGLLVGPADPGALALALIQLLEDKHLRTEMGQAGRRLFEKGPWTPKTAADTTLRIYDQAIAAALAYEENPLFQEEIAAR